MTNKFTLRQALTLCDAELETLILQVYEANEKGEVFRTDEPKWCFYCWQEYYIGYLHVENIGEVEGYEYPSLKDFNKVMREKGIDDIFDLTCLGFREIHDFELQDKGRFAICCKI